MFFLAFARSSALALIPTITPPGPPLLGPVAADEPPTGPTADPPLIGAVVATELPLIGAIVATELPALLRAAVLRRRRVGLLANGRLLTARAVTWEISRDRDAHACRDQQ